MQKKYVTKEKKKTEERTKHIKKNRIKNFFLNETANTEI